MIFGSLQARDFGVASWDMGLACLLHGVALGSVGYTDQGVVYRMGSGVSVTYTTIIHPE